MCSSLSFSLSDAVNVCGMKPLPVIPVRQALEETNMRRNETGRPLDPPFEIHEQIRGNDFPATKLLRDEGRGRIEINYGRGGGRGTIPPRGGEGKGAQKHPAGAKEAPLRPQRRRARCSSAADLCQICAAGVAVTQTHGAPEKGPPWYFWPQHSPPHLPTKESWHESPGGGGGAGGCLSRRG